MWGACMLKDQTQKKTRTLLFPDSNPLNLCVEGTNFSENSWEVFSYDPCGELKGPNPPPQTKEIGQKLVQSGFRGSGAKWAKHTGKLHSLTTHTPLIKGGGLSPP